MGDFFRKIAEKDTSAKPSVLEMYRQASVLAHDNALRNPGDKESLSAAEFAMIRLSNQLVREDRVKEALPILKEAAEISGKLVKEDPSTRRNHYLFAMDSHLLGNYLMHAKRWQEAADALQRSADVVRPALQRWPGDLELLSVQAMILVDQTTTERTLGHRAAARERCQTAMNVAADLIARQKDLKRAVWDVAALQTEARLLQVRDLTTVSH